MEAFRNFGLAKDGDGFKPSSETLILDRNFEPGKAGGLVLLIGENGAGKSNALDAVNHFAWTTDNRFIDKDYTIISWNTECRRPRITMSCTCAGSLSNKQKFSITKENGGVFSFSPEAENSATSVKQKDLKDRLFSNFFTLCQIEADTFLENRYTNSRPIETRLNDILNDVIRTHCKDLSADFKIDISGCVYPGSEAYKEFLKQVQSQIMSSLKLSTQEIDRIKERIWSVIREYMDFAHRQESSIYDPHKDMYERFVNEVYYKIGNDLRFFAENDQFFQYRTNFKERFNIDLVGKVFEYKSEPFSDKDLESRWTNISNSRLFSALFKALSYDIAIVEDRYQTYKQLDGYGILKDLQEDINQKLPKVANDFNKLYNSPSKYSFEIDLSKDEIHFLIRKGNQRVVLKNEATGFIYFFNMYFGLLYDGSLKPGDIITMDEPATNLSVPAQKELRAFLKDFAIRNQVLILCATHCPFLISPDNLDELRIVSCDENGIASIDNEYTLLSKHSKATVDVKRALTIENYQIIKPGSKVVFVESMEEYNILTAFKKVLDIEGINDIYFFPIGKVDEDEDIAKLMDEIRRINKQNPIILLPNGTAFKRIGDYCQKDAKSRNVLVRNYSSFINKKSIPDHSIRTLFVTDSLCLKYGSYYFKNHIPSIKDSLSDKTRDNFREIFKKILNDIDE